MKQFNRKTFEAIRRIVHEDNNVEYKTYNYDYYFIKMNYPLLTNLAYCFEQLETPDETIEQVMNLLGFELVEGE